METHRLVVPRSARYATLGRFDGRVRDVWIACHGFGQLATEFLQTMASVADPTRLLVAPEALSRFYHEDHERVGASWMTREDRVSEMEDYVRYLDLLHENVFQLIDRPTTTLRLLGFSQGAATAARWAVRGAAKIDHLILWGSALPPELEDQTSLGALTRMRVTLVRGSRDGVLAYEAWNAQQERLRRLGVAYDVLTFDGGHRLDDDTLRALAGS